MAFKQKQDALVGMLDVIIADCEKERTTSGFTDIITFCEDARYLNFLGQEPKMQLWDMQKIVLKIFYRGTRGNEHLQLNDREIELINEIADEEESDYEDAYGGFRQILEKYDRGTIFSHLLLIMGRRSSKTTLVSIIAAYEAYKLLEAPNGNPQAYYGIAPDKSICILNIATNKEQALDPLFKEIESRIARGPYFQDKVNHDACKEGTIKLLTLADKRENADRKKRGMSVLSDGSITLMSGHSNSRSLRGHATICILLDEFAHFRTSSGISSGDEVYNALMPSTKQFGADGKMIIISDPLGKEGMFWKLFELSQKREEKNGKIIHQHDDILGIQLPTWRVNPSKEFSKKHLEASELPKAPVEFYTTWGARFTGSAGMKMFDSARLDACFDFAWREPQFGEPQTTYHLHLDPATSGHNYALALVHVATSINKFGSSERRVIVDLVKYWHPDQRGPVDINAVQEEAISICKRFKVATVTFDSWNSAQTIQNLQRRGIRAFETPFKDGYINEIYGELRNLINQGQISICPDRLLKGEMENLCYKMTGRGMTKIIDKKSEYKTDDGVDAVAGATFQAIHHIVSHGWPKSKVVNMSAMRRR